MMMADFIFYHIRFVFFGKEKKIILKLLLYDLFSINLNIIRHVVMFYTRIV